MIVCVPFRGGDPQREMIWAFAKQRWQDHGFSVFEGDSDMEQPFSVAQARNVAAEAAGDWEVALFADADIILGDTSQAETALARARDLNGYVCPYDQLGWLEPKPTAKILGGAPPTLASAYYVLGKSWLMTFAISRALWDEIDGFDSAYADFDGEDVSFFEAVKALVGVDRIDRVPGAAFHLYHAPREHRYRGEGTA